MGLVVAPEDPSAGPEDVDAVGRGERLCAIAGFDGDPAGEKTVVGAEQAGRSRALELRHRLVVGAARILEGVGDRSLRPKQKPRLVGRRTREDGQPPRGFLVETGPPLVLLADVRLDDAHGTQRQRVDRDR